MNPDCVVVNANIAFKALVCARVFSRAEKVRPILAIDNQEQTLSR
jgi:hypothetical protein